MCLSSTGWQHEAARDCARAGLRGRSCLRHHAGVVQKLRDEENPKRAEEVARTPRYLSAPVSPSVRARARPILRDLYDRAELVHLAALLPLHPPPPPDPANGAEPHRVMLLLLRPALPS